ncbi:MAG: DsbA family protein [Syntrophales bacterium]
MRLIRILVTILLVFAGAAPAAAGDPAVTGDRPPFPVFGTGAVEVRLYSDYFCPPCQQVEPLLDPLLKDLLMRKAIRLVLVDFPMHDETPLYARYFLYALKSRSDVDHALRVRSVLFHAAAGKDLLTAPKIEGLLQKNKISYTAFDPKPSFERYNALIQEDKVRGTPTVVIVRGGSKETFVGGPDIIKALNGLK